MATQQRVLYVENNVGRAFCDAFNLFSGTLGWGAMFQNDIHPAMQRRQRGDEWWLTEVAAQGYALLTCDMAIASIGSERDTVMRTGLRYVGFANGEYDGWVQLGAVNRHWENLARELDEPGPVIIKLYAGATPPAVERP